MCSLFGLIDFKECLSTHTKNKILNTLARECQTRGTDATGIAYNFNDRLRIYKRPPSRSEDENPYSARCERRDGAHPYDYTGQCAV